jgi:nucleoside-diphosphate-sugar epimerase
MANATVLITGATGLVGRCFARKAAAAGYDVQAMVRPNSNRSALDGIPVTFVEADLAQPESLPAALVLADIVVHAAAHVGDWGPAEQYRAINVVALEHMLHAVQRQGRLRRAVDPDQLARRLSGPPPLRHRRDRTARLGRARRLHAH